MAMRKIPKTVNVALAGLLFAGCALGAIAWWGGWPPFGGQTLPGRLTEYYKTYDKNWELACDAALDGSDRRCFAQYVEVYRPRPEFAAAMVEVVYHAGDDGGPNPHVRFDIEPGLRFRDATVTVETPDGDVPLDVSDCRSNTCRFNGAAAQAILDSWRRGSFLRLEIDEGRAATAKLVWPLDEMTALLDDFERQRAARELP